MDVPILYRCQNVIESANVPPGVRTLDNATAGFYSRYLMKRAISAVKLDLPKDSKGRDLWAKNYVQYTLFGRGYGAVVEVPRYGVIFQGGTFYGRNVYYQPTRFQTANPLFLPPPQGWIIGKNCALVKLQPDFAGIQDIVDTYAARLALAYEAWQMNNQNSKLAYVFGAENKAQAASFEGLFDRVQSGIPAVATGKNLYSKDGKPLWTFFNNDLRQNYIAPDISDDMRAIMSEFDSFVGIPSNPDSTKKERQIVDEVNSNNIETDTLLDTFVNCLNEGFEQAEDLFGVKARASKRYNTGADVKGGE